MKDLYIIYHIKDGHFWLLYDLNLIKKTISWSAFTPHIFSSFEIANLIAEQVRVAMPDYNVFVCTFDNLPDFIKRNREADIRDGRELDCFYRLP